MRYGIVGMGAVGGYFGAKLQQAGADVHFLRRTAAAEARRVGLTVHSPQGMIQLPQIQVYDVASDLPPCDVVLVALKATHNAALAQILPAMLAPGGSVFVLQNGLDPEASAAAVAGAERVVGAMCVLCAATSGIGVVEHWAEGSLTLGPYAARPAASTRAHMQAVQADFTRVGVPCVLTDDLRQARWRKLVWNIPFNALSVLLRASTQQLLQDPHSEALILALMDEVLQAARAAGVYLPDTLPGGLVRFTRALPDYKTSMQVDHERGLPLEVQAIVGDPLRAALQAGAQLPRLTMLHDLLASVAAAQPGVPHG